MKQRTIHVNIGERYGKWTVIQSDIENVKPSCFCRCDCGTEKKVQVYSLVKGLSQSCGCRHKEIISQLKKQDLTGQRFGKLVALKDLGSIRYGKRTQRLWLCQCDCGNQAEKLSGHLMGGKVSSCGCLVKENNWIRKHGLSHTPEYSVWSGMINRCYNENRENYAYYGGRGIRVCDRWHSEDGFLNFLADMGERPSGMTIDRIDNDGDYTPQNCRWATWEEQMEKQEVPIYMQQKLNPDKWKAGFMRAAARRRMLKKS